MARMNDQNYLRGEQYKDSSNLNARAQLHWRFGVNPQGWHEWVWAQYDIPAQATILELGAGPGWMWQNAPGPISAGWQVTLSDYSPGMVEEQKRNLAEIDHPFTHQVIDAQTIPFEDATFDVVIANHMLYHVPDLEKALTEINRVLKPGGTLYAATNGEKHMYEMRQIARRFVPDSVAVEQHSAAAYFGLESAVPTMKRHFDTLDVRHYENALKVTEAQPIIDYLLSGISLPSDELATQFDALQTYLQAQIDEHGAIHIQKATGMFVAGKATA